MNQPLPHVVTTATYKNPHATMPFGLRYMVIRNTSDEQIEKNIRANAAKDLDWVEQLEPNNGIAILAGGGPSIADYLEEIQSLQVEGGTIFAANAASQYLRAHGIRADYQVIGDAKPESAALVDEDVPSYLIGSQVDPSTLDRAMEHGRVQLWHIYKDGVEEWFPPERVKRGGYGLFGGTAAVGDYMARIAYALGFRELHIFGYDSCHRGNAGHAYKQPMNDGMPCTTVEWGDRKFTASVAMKAQAEKFQLTGDKLEKSGCDLHIYGDGLLQTMWRTRGTYTNEKDKYRRLWLSDFYRHTSPGESLLPYFLEVAKPEEGARIIDFGCGTGRASVKLNEAGYKPVLVDFADNCRDQEAIWLPFIEHDLTEPLKINAPYGYCTDVMEHIPTEDVVTVIDNIMASAERVFFNISTRDDLGGAFINAKLHLTVKPHSWWRYLFTVFLGHKVLWEFENEGMSALFYIERKDG